jgi:hypothetical protein
MNYFNKVRGFVIDSFTKTGGIRGLTHFDRTIYWIEQLKPSADEALKIAAIAHDIERAFRDPSKDPANESDLGFKSNFFLKYHPKNGAEIIGEFLKKENAPPELIDRVTILIAKHEVGGDEDQNLLKDADSISYFENQADHFIAHQVPSMGAEKVRAKFEWMYERITSDKARKIAKPLHDVAMAKLLK